MLALRDITKTYQVGPTQLDILKGANLTVPEGELLAIMGKSGSGKSTLMNIIGLLDRPSSGSYTLNDRSITQYHDDELSEARNELIGFVFQSFYLLPRQSALENVMLPLRYRKTSVNESRERAMMMLEKVDMAERADHRPNELSGGQRQRVAIARALVGSPRLILADEPTGALDPRVGKEIMNLFIELNQREGITIVIITHDPSVAERCQRTVIMEDGRLREANDVSH